MYFKLLFFSIAGIRGFSPRTRRAVFFGRILFQAMTDDSPHLARETFPHCVDGARFIFDFRRDHRIRSVTLEGSLACDPLVPHHTQAEDVGAVIDHLAPSSCLGDMYDTMPRISPSAVEVADLTP